jgi:hypothetical protein
MRKPRSAAEEEDGRSQLGDGEGIAAGNWEIVDGACMNYLQMIVFF